MRLVALVIFFLVMGIASVDARIIWAPEESVGATALKAKQITIGYVTTIREAPAQSPHVPRYHVTVDVSETLLGAQTQRLQFSVTMWSPTIQKKLGEPVLIAMNHDGNLSLVVSMAPSRPLYHLWPQGRAVDEWRSRILVNDFLEPLYTNDQVLGEIRNTVAEHATAKLATVDSVRPPMIWQDETVVAVTAAVEAESRRRLEAGVGEWNAAEILIQHPTPANLEALRRFAWRLPAAEPGKTGFDQRCLLIQALHVNGVRNLPPLVPHGPHSLSNVALLIASIIALPTAYLLWRRRRSRVWTIAWCLLFGIVMTAWYRSYYQLDAFSIGNIDIPLIKGDLVVRSHNRARQGYPDHFQYLPVSSLQSASRAEAVGTNGFIPGPSRKFVPDQNAKLNALISLAIGTQLERRDEGIRRYLIERRFGILYMPLWIPAVLLTFFPGAWVFMGWFRRLRGRRQSRFEVLPPREL